MTQYFVTLSGKVMRIFTEVSEALGYMQYLHEKYPGYEVGIFTREHIG